MQHLIKNYSVKQTNNQRNKMFSNLISAEWKAVFMDRYCCDMNMGLCSHAGAVHHIAMDILFDVVLVDRKDTVWSFS